MIVVVSFTVALSFSPHNSLPDDPHIYRNPHSNPHLHRHSHRTVDALITLKKSCPDNSLPSPVQFFLHNCYNQHLQMVHAYYQRKEEERKPMIMSVDGLEFGNTVRYRPVDTNRFLVPTPLLQYQSFATTAPILPLLRCLGVANALRLLSGLLSERRIVLISSSPTRLTTCCLSALSILSQGLLSWQHFLMPVLPPHLMQYLQAPFPYLIGILSALLPSLQQLPELGEVMIINLDTNDLETRGMATHEIATKIPDLFRSGMREESNIQNLGAPTQVQGASFTAPQCLAEDLVQLLKADKKAIQGDTSIGGNIVNSAQVKKATKAVKSAFGKIRGKLLQSNDASPEELLTPARKDLAADDEIYTEGCQNEVGEEEARVAFCNFFLCIFGDMRLYLTPPQPGQMPSLDRERFLHQKSQMGEGKGSPMFPLLQNICQSQMFEQFVKTRVDEISRRVPVTKDAPLFNVCANYHRSHNVDFSVLNVRQVTRQVAQANPSRLISQANANARRMAMSLTSNKGFEGDVNRGLAQLVEYCRETTVLTDVMSVVWMRLRSCKGGQWKHGYLGLQIVRNLLFHGPLAAIAEATDGLDKIRALKFYKETMRSQNAQQVQLIANEVYNLLVDRAKLFSIRRICGNRRVELGEKRNYVAQKDQQVRFGMSFRSLHPYMHPKNDRRVAPAPVPPPQIPPAPVQQQQQPAAPSVQQQQQQYYAQQQRRASYQQQQQQVPPAQRQAYPPQPPPQPAAPAAGLDDLLGLGSPAPAAPPPVPAVASGSVSSLSASMSSLSVANPFDPFGAPVPAAASAAAAAVPQAPPTDPFGSSTLTPTPMDPPAQYQRHPSQQQLPGQPMVPPAVAAPPPQYPGYPPQQPPTAPGYPPQQQIANPFAAPPAPAQQQPPQQRPGYSQFDPMGRI